MIITKTLVIEKIQKKINDKVLGNSFFHSFGHQSSKTSEEASKLGLTYMGFGRYGKKDKVTHIVQKDKLVPVSQSPKDNLSKYDDSYIDKQLDDFHSRIETNNSPEHDKKTKDILDRYYHDRGKFAAINSYLINKKEEKPDLRMKKRIQKLDSIFVGSRVPKDTVVFTGMKEPIKKEGIYSSKAYRSATTQPKNVYGASSDIIELHLEKGRRAIFVDSNEVLLPRNLKFRILGKPISTKNNKIWKAEIITI